MVQNCFLSFFLDVSLSFNRVRRIGCSLFHYRDIITIDHRLRRWLLN